MNTETMNTELLWQRMQKDWQSAQPSVDTSVLVQQINRRHRCTIKLLAFDIGGAFGFTGLFAYWMFTGHGLGITLNAILLAIIWTNAFLSLWIRRGTWRAQGTDTRSLLRLVERRARAGIRYAWLQIIGGPVAFGIAGALQWQVSSAQAVPGWILLGAVFVAANIWVFRLLRRQRRRLQHARALLEQLSRDDDNP